jgi:hypothetical protein
VPSGRGLWVAGVFRVSLTRPRPDLRENDHVTLGRADRQGGQSGRRVTVTDRVELSHQARDFLRATVGRDRRRRGRSTTILSTLLVLAAVTAVAQRNVAAEQRAAEKGQRLATARGANATANTRRYGRRADPTCGC